MELSKTKIQSMWKIISKKIKNRNFSETIFINAFKEKVKILALFSKNGEDVIQLEQIGFIIFNKTIFSPSAFNIISDQGIITNDYFTGEIIDVNNTIISNIYIHLVKVNSGPIVINDIPLYLIINENHHQSLVNNKIANKLFINILIKHLNCKKTNFSYFFINEKYFIITINNFKTNIKQILQVEFIINDLLEKKLSLDKLFQLRNKKYFSYLKKFNEFELQKITNLQKIAIINIKNYQKKWKIKLMSGNKQLIENFFINAKKPIIGAINIINKKIRLIDQLEHIQPIVLSSINVIDYQSLLQLQKIHKKILKLFSKWQFVFQKKIENLLQNFSYGYYSEVINNFKITHYSFNNDLLDYNLMEIKGRQLLINNDNNVVFISNNIIDNYSMIFLFSKNINLICDLKSLINKIIKKKSIKISFKNDIIIFSNINYQFINDFITKIIDIFKLDNFQHYLQINK